MKMREGKWNLKRSIAALLCATTILTNTGIVQAAEYVDFTDVQEEIVETVETTGMSEQEGTATETTEAEVLETEMVESEVTERVEETESVEEESEIIEAIAVIEEATEEVLEGEEIAETELVEEVKQERIKMSKASGSFGTSPTMYDVYLAEYWKNNGEYNYLFHADGNYTGGGYATMPYRSIVVGLENDKKFCKSLKQWESTMFAFGDSGNQFEKRDMYDRVVYSIITAYYEDKLSPNAAELQKQLDSRYNDLMLYLGEEIETQYDMTLEEYEDEYVDFKAEELMQNEGVVTLANSLSKLEVFSECGFSKVVEFMDLCNSLNDFMEKSALVTYLSQTSGEISDILLRASNHTNDAELRSSLQNMAACCGTEVSEELFNSIYSGTIGAGAVKAKAVDAVKECIGKAWLPYKAAMITADVFDSMLNSCFSHNEMVETFYYMRILCKLEDALKSASLDLYSTYESYANYNSQAGMKLFSQKYCQAVYLICCCFDMGLATAEDYEKYASDQNAMKDFVISVFGGTKLDEDFYQGYLEKSSFVRYRIRDFIKLGRSVATIQYNNYLAELAKNSTKKSHSVLTDYCDIVPEEIIYDENHEEDFQEVQEFLSKYSNIYVTEDFEIREDKNISGKLILLSGRLSIVGCTMQVDGDVIIKGGILALKSINEYEEVSDGYYELVDRKPGILKVVGDLSIGTEGEIDEEGHRLATSTGILNMDSMGNGCEIYIGGDFSICSANKSNIKNGTIYLEGDFAQYGTTLTNATDWAWADNFNHDSRAKIVFCGSEKQSIYFDSLYYDTLEPCSSLNIIEFKNKDIEILSEIRNWKLVQDTELNLILPNDELRISDELDLNGYKLTINGNLNLLKGKIRVNGGSLYVNGDFSIGKQGELEELSYGEVCRKATSEGCLVATDEKDIVTVEGDFEICSSEESYLYDGIMYLKGDFYKYGNSMWGAEPFSFNSAENHVVVLCGNEEQNIYFEEPGDEFGKNNFVGFNKLICTKPIENYTFFPENCWKELVTSANKFSVTYVLNGGTNAEENLSEYELLEEELKLFAATREGYAFDGWYLDAEFTQPISVIPANNTEDMTLYAKWLGAKYVINYKYVAAMDPNGVAQRVSYQNVFENEGAVVLPMPNPIPGYQFSWYSDKACKNIITTLDADVAENVTVYGKWTDASYYVALDANGGTGTMDEQKILYKSSVAIRKNTFKKAGYTFAGWNTAADGTGTAYKNAQKVKGLVSEAEGKITLYAQWTPVSYKITYKNVDKNTVNTNPATYNCETGVALIDPSKSGYTFNGWYTDAKFTKPISAISAEYGKAITVYAKWTANDYTIVFDGNGADNEAEIDLGSLSCTYGKGKKLTKNTYVKSGYTFAGWNTKADGSGKAYKNQASVKDAGTEVSEEVTLYAQWQVISYKITYKNIDKKMTNPNPVSYSMEGDVVLTAPERTGYTFDGWYSDSKFTKPIEVIECTGTKAVTVYAKWSANDYTIVFDGNGADNEAEVDLGSLSCTYGKGKKLAKNTYVKKGYTFTGWNTKADGTGKSYKNQASVKDAGTENDEMVTLYAQWKVVSYKITYKNIDKKMTNNNPSTFSIEGDVRLETPVRTGYTFDGWYTDSKFKNPIEVIEHIGTKAVTVYAKWTANEYTIVFVGNGADNEVDVDMSPLECTYAKAKKLSKNLYEKQGYKFNGWNTKADGSGKAYKNQASVKDAGTKAGEEVILYAQWQVINYKINYKNIDKKMANENPATYNIEGDVRLIEPIRVDYVFAGWYTDAKFTNPIEVIDGSTGKNLTLYAKWIKE